MKKSIIRFLSVIILGFNVSCEKDTESMPKDIFNSWEFVDFISIESAIYSKEKEFNPVIEFSKNGTYSLQLDVNNCSGNFEISGETGIDITLPGCTKMCCDSNFSSKMKEMLAQVESYSIKEKNLILNVYGWGWINLKLND